MGARGDSRTKVERASERELAVSRTFNSPARLVYEAWTKPELFMRWWAPKSTGVPMLSCEMNVHAGGGYRIAFGHDPASAMSFFGKYLEVVPNARLVWTNEESDDAAVTTVTFEDRGDNTLLILRELYASKEALDSAFIGMEGCAPEQFNQLEELLATLDASVG
ncbi:MAG: SRPBCC family protein [Alphaproteobacteria bacterium]